MNRVYVLTGTFQFQMNNKAVAVNGILAGVVRLNVNGAISMPTLGLNLTGVMNIGYLTANKSNSREPGSIILASFLSYTSASLSATHAKSCFGCHKNFPGCTRGVKCPPSVGFDAARRVP